MTPLSELKRVWQEAPAGSLLNELGKEQIRVLLRDRSANLKKRVLKRLSSEIATYLLLGLFLLCISLISGFGSGRRVFLGAVTLLVIIPSIAVLAYKEYSLRTLPMSGTLRESVDSLIKTIDSTASLYLLA